MTMKGTLWVVVIITAAGLAGCPAQPRDNPPDDPTDPIDEPFFVDINAVPWQVQCRGPHSFLFTSVPEGWVSSAAIVGAETDMVLDESRPLQGSFEHRAIHFTTSMGDDVREFTGTFRDEMTMELMSSASAIPVILIRCDRDAR